jgi:hypothetical protein
VPSPNAPAAFSTRLLAVHAHAGWPLFATGDVQSQAGPYHTLALRST